MGTGYLEALNAAVESGRRYLLADEGQELDRGEANCSLSFVEIVYASVIGCSTEGGSTA
jgi:hypothetical protein